VIELNAPTHWDDEALSRWAGLQTGDRVLASVFGSRQEQLVGHGRAPGDVPPVDDATIVRHAAVSRALGIQFLYLLNGRCTSLDIANPSIRARLDSDVEWIVETVGADAIVVADPRVAAAIRERYRADRVAIRVSTIAGVRTPGELSHWLSHEIDGVVLHHDVGRDFAVLRAIVTFLHRAEPGAEVELLLNETCLHGCTARDAHYERLAAAKLTYAEGFQQTCNLPKFRNPSLLLSARWIRPEDLTSYLELGIRRFKIAGREMPKRWLDRAIGAYLAGTYEGNLIDLFTMTPPGLEASAADVFFIDNRALDGFLSRLQTWSGREVEFYRTLAGELWNTGALRVRDHGASYSSIEGFVRCVDPGDQQARLIQLQQHRDDYFRRARGGAPPGDAVGTREN